MLFLVTGAGGYVGSVLCQELLSAGHEVVAVDRPGAVKNLAHALGHPWFRWLPGDVTDPGDPWWDRVRGADVVVPLAALVGQDACSGREGDAYRLNRDAVAGLVGRLARRQKVVYCNTNSGYGCGEAARKGVYTEADPMDPATDYGRSKMGGEAAVLDHPGGVSLRLGSGMGASPAMRWDVLAHDFLKRVLAASRDEAPVELYEPDALRNFVHVRDVARAVREAAERDWSGAYNLNHPQHHTKRDLHRACEAALGVSVPVFDVPGRDPDRRDGRVDPGKALGAGFEFRLGLLDALAEAAALLRGEGTQA